MNVFQVAKFLARVTWLYWTNKVELDRYLDAELNRRES